MPFLMGEIVLILEEVKRAISNLTELTPQQIGAIRCYDAKMMQTYIKKISGCTIT